MGFGVIENFDASFRDDTTVICLFVEEFVSFAFFFLLVCRKCRKGHTPITRSASLSALVLGAATACCFLGPMTRTYIVNSANGEKSPVSGRTKIVGRDQDVAQASRLACRACGRRGRGTAVQRSPGRSDIIVTAVRDIRRFGSQ